MIEEYLNGELLSVWMKRTHGEEEIREVFLQMLRIVRALHHMTPPIIHRDLKPENFMVTDRGIVLFDFDVSRPYAKGEGVSTLVGTIGYAAPEQLGFEQSDPRSDIYSLGVILNELCCGHLPAVKQSSLYREVIRRCTKLDPADRYQSIEELREAFAPGSMRVPHKRGIVLLGYTLISGMIKNNTDQTPSYVQVTFNLYDEEGNQIGTAMDNINDLEAGRTWKFEAVSWEEGVASYRLAEISGF